MEDENSIGTVVDRITCSYVRYAVVTNLRSAMPKALEAGFPASWSFHVNILHGTILWTNDDVPCTVSMTPGRDSDFDTSICVEVLIDPNNHGVWYVDDVEKLASLVESQNLDDGLIIPMEWTGDPDFDALKYLMQVMPILVALGGE